MQQPEPASLEDGEEIVRQTTLEHHGAWVSSLDRLLNGYLLVFKERGAFTRTAGRDREYVWFLLSAKAFNSLRWSVHLLKTGYYHQALTLIRSVWEDWLVSVDSENHPCTVEAVLSKGKRIASFRTMADRLPGPLMQEWQDQPNGQEGSYGVMSTFAHPRWRGLRMLIEPDSRLLRLGPQYEQTLFLITFIYLAEVAVRMLGFSVRACGVADATLHATLAPVVEEVEASSKQALAEAERRLSTLEAGEGCA